MSWGHASLLSLFALVVALLLIRIWWSVRVRRTYASVGVGLDEHTAHVGRRRERLRQVLLWSGLCFGVIALAAPRWGSAERSRSSTGADVLLALDCSRSMMATDLYPTRMEAARRKALDMLRLAPELRIALMPFAAMPVLRCPLTGDHQALGEMLTDCSPELFPADAGYQGTAIGAAVREGLGFLGREVERGQAIVVMSDGSDDDKEAVKTAAEAAKAAGVPIYGLFLGDRERKVTLMIDGKEETMDSDKTTLDSLATATGAISVNATNTDNDVQAVIDHLTHTVAQRPWEERQRVVASERYQWFVWPAIVLLGLG
ncbi:MAG: VWA domain-containing protein, partial [Planctomycetota bacterium]